MWRSTGNLIDELSFVPELAVILIPVATAVNGIIIHQFSPRISSSDTNR